jgi:23S rRNA (uracil1939-C5)-methyltransferase
MSKARPFKKYQRVELEIADMAFEGKGIARIETDEGHYIVFVPNTIPGQQVLVQIIKTKPRFAEAKLIKVLNSSPEEVKLPYVSIPGAPYINLPLDRQHFYKRKTSIELFRRIGGVEHAADILDEFITSPLSFHYRNKMEYSFSAVEYIEESDSFEDGFTLGFKKRGQWLAGVNLTGDSGMFDQQFEQGLPRIREYFVSRGFKAWHARERHGFCRFLTVRKSYSQDALLINFTSSKSQLAEFNTDEFRELILDILGDRLHGLVHTINDDPGDRPKTTQGKQILLFGKDHITEDILDLKFDISLESFFQTNPASAALLYQKALNYVRESDIHKPVILDLFSGTGTISQLLAKDNRDKKVIGVEIVKEAVLDAKRSADRNGFNNLEFVVADVGRFLLDHPQYQGEINTLVMDPPRAGIAPKTLRKVIRLGADRMVYISCNPATQARDIAILREHDYKLIKYSLVDQFPHTAHIESVALFERGKSGEYSPATVTD